MKHYSTKELLAASEKVPSSIQEALSSETTISTISNLGTKFQLHIDQIGLVAELNVQVLLGLIGPEEFLKELIAVGISDKDAREIMAEINQKIFVPLRKEEEKGVAVEPQKIVPEPTSHFKLENKIPLPPPTSQPQKTEKSIPSAIVSQGNLPPKVFLPRPAEALSVGGPRPATLGEVVRSVLAVPKPIENSKLLEDHEEPHIEINQVPVAPQGNAARPVVAPENLPGVMLEPVIPEAPIPEVRPSPEFSKVEPQMQFKSELAPEIRPLPIPKVESQIQKPALVAPVEPKPVSAPITSYSSDPYREPIDEPPKE